MTATVFVRNPDRLAAWIMYLHDTSGLTYRQIAEKPYFSRPPSMPHGTIYAIGKGLAVPKKYRAARGIRHSVETDPCPTCGAAPTVCLCDGSRVVKPRPASKRTTPPRFTVYSGTDTAKILLELEKLTGRRWACLDEPMEY